MHPRGSARALVAGLVVMLAMAASARAAGPRTSEPLNQYEVGGKVSADQLARAGFDLHEGTAGDKRTIVATPTQARSLRRSGAIVQARSLAAPLAARASALVDPTHGYDVFRPWSLNPAPCPTTCATPLEPLKQWYHRLAAAHPDIVKEYTIGHSVLGQPIKAYKLTAGASWLPDGVRPVTLYESTQHAREWIATEVQRRLFAWFVEHRNDAEVKRLLQRNEIWIIPVVNPDGYDYTFTAKGTRLWRKNLRDVNGDGVIDAAHDGVDPNRNWPEKWNYDLEGASDDPSTETYHGAGPASEPEVAAVRRLHKRLRPKFLIDYHSFAKLILYPEGWQVETEATDAPLMKALAGTDAKPAIPGFDPDVSGELYTTNGDVTGDAYNSWGTQAYTVELSGGEGPEVGGTVDGPDSLPPGGFVFQDSEAAVQAEFEKNLAFALDLAKSAPRPDRPRSHLDNSAPNYVPSSFAISYGDPQTVEVNAKRSVGPVWVTWQVNGGAVHKARTTEYDGGERYGAPGRYYHRLRGQVTGTAPGDSVRVRFINLGGVASQPFTYRVQADSGAPVLLVTAEDYTGNLSAREEPGPYAGPLYQDDYEQALKAAGVAYDVYDVDARGRTAPSSLGVLSHYKAVIWETGEDIYPRDLEQPAGTGTAKLLDDELLAARDYLNDGGKLLVAGKLAFQAAWDQVLYNPLPVPPGAYCPDDGTVVPEGQVDNCVAVANDFQQYYLGAYLPIGAAFTTEAAGALPFDEVNGGPFSGLSFSLNGADSAANQDNVSSFLTTSSILPEATYPQFESHRSIVLDRPPLFDPPTGTQYAISQATDDAYKRLTKTIDLTGKTAADLSFKVSFDTEPGWDFLFVEAHTVGSDDWTTLPDANGATTTDTGDSCGLIPLTDEHPFIDHYTTFVPGPTADDGTCTPTGTTGTWNAATGNSGGFVDWKSDLSGYAGKQVEVSISYLSDEAVQGLGVFVDDATVTADGQVLDTTSFEGDLGGWAVPGPPAGTPGNANDWITSPSLGYQDGPGVATADTVFWGFGLEGVTGADARATLLKDHLAYLGVTSSG